MKKLLQVNMSQLRMGRLGCPSGVYGLTYLCHDLVWPI